MFGRRAFTLLVGLALVGAPAVVMRALCVGRSCDAPAEASATAPFCRLPDDLRRDLRNGYREERSPDVFAVAAEEGSIETDGTPWPGVERRVRRVPIVVTTNGAGQDASEPIGAMSLDQVAPTVAEVMGLDRAHPDVRSGTAHRDLVETLGAAPNALLIGIKGWAELDASPTLQEMARDGASGTVLVGSTPRDPAALFATAGTGGVPRQHGITARIIRNASGRPVPSWGPDAPTSVIAALADDLDEMNDGKATVGMVAHAATDRGLIGDGWYVGSDRDGFVVEPRPRRAARALAAMAAGLRQPAVFGLTLDVAAGEEAVAKAIAVARRAVERGVSGDVVTVAFGTGPSSGASMGESELLAGLGTSADLVEDVVPGGFFVDQQRLARTGETEDDLVRSLKRMRMQGRPLFADVFTSISVAFGRYC